MSTQTYPLSQSQMGVYLECLQSPDSIQYNLPCHVRFSKNINTQKLKTAVEKVIAAYPIFYTRVATSDGELYQSPDYDLRIEVSVEQLEETAVAQRLAQFFRPFDLQKDVLSRFLLIETPQYVHLVYDHHHLIFDGLSYALLLHLFELAYNGLELPAEEVSLYEYAKREQETFQTPQYAQSAQYYKEKFAGIEMTKLPEKTNDDMGKVEKVSVLVPKSPIDSFCSEQGVTANLLFMAAFEIVLSRICREKNIAYSSINHGRNDKKVRETLGMFVKTVPILAQLNDTQSVIEFIKGHKQELMSTIRNGIYPFTHLCQHLGIKPELTFGFQGLAISEDRFVLGEHPAIEQPVADGLSSENVSVIIYETTTEYEIRLKYVDNQYETAFMQRFAGAIAACTEQLIAAANGLLKDISIVSETEKQQLIDLGRGECLDYDRTQTIIDLFSRQTALSPDAIAVVFEDRQYTYQQIDRLSTRLAVHLREQGVGREQAVGVMIDRSEWMVIYPLAIMKAGAAYMPLDYHFPSDRLSYMIEDARVSLILSEPGRVESVLPEYSGRVIITTEVMDLPSTTQSLDYRPAREDMYVILYTSGSTGQPKGCVLEHHNLLNFCLWYIKDFEVTAADRSLAYANFGFDAHMMDIYPLLVCGAAVYILPSTMRMDIAAINHYIEQQHITIAFLTTQIGVQIASLFENNSLRLLSVGGEKLLPIKKPSYRFYNGYGPTECTIYSSFYEMKSDYDNEYIGRPLANYQLYVLDQEMNLLPRGIAGELCVSGDGVGRGYLNRPEQTADKFVVRDGQRIYRTGDLVRWAENDNIQYLGRIDRQVKLRGFRIELGEIESAMSRFVGVQSAVVEVKTVGSVQQLCGYYTSENPIDENMFREHLAASLTDYMVPTVFMRLEVFPLTPNGKVNRNALPVPEIVMEEIVAPETTLEQSFFEIVAEQLGTKSFGVTTNLISMGLTSIGAIKLSLAVQRQLNLILQTKDILHRPTIRQWTQLTATAENAVKSYEERDFYPVTENILGGYWEWEQHRDCLQYNMPVAIKLTNTDPQRLKAAIEKVIEAHPYLKVRLMEKNRQIFQIRRDNEPTHVSIETLAQEPDAGFFQSRIRPFNLLEDELYRFKIYVTAQNVYLFIDIHHFIFDGASYLLFFGDLEKAYKGVALEKETFTAYDYALEQQQWIRSAAYHEAESYFDQLVKGAESVLYPPSILAKAPNHCRKVEWLMPRSTVAKACKRLNVTENCFMLTAYLQVIHRVTHKEEILITTISNGRSSTHLANMFGMCIQKLPVVSRLDNQTVSGSLSMMQAQLFDTFKNENYAFMHLAERHDCVANIEYIYQGEVLDKEFYVSEDPVEIIELHNTTPQEPISIEVIPDGESYHLVVEYDYGIYTEQDMLNMARYIESVATSMAAAESDRPISAIAMVTAAEAEELIALGSGELTQYDRNETFVDLFLKQVALCPDSVAVVDDTSSITYAQLNQQSDALAGALVDSGVGSETLVAVMLPRQKEFLVSTLAVFKAGGAYVPLDADYPNERLLYMLQDSEAKILITTRELLAQKQKEGDFPTPQVLFVDEFDFQQSGNPINRSRPLGLAYMIYTSGSTGKPKGTMIEHKGLRALVDWLVPLEALRPGECCAEHSSFSFDASVFDLYPPLTVGAEVHILSSSLRRDAAGIYEYFKQHNIVGATFSTQFGAELLNQYDLPLRYIVLGGEQLYPVRPCSVKIINGYGPTEFTVCSSYHVVEQGREYTSIPIGRPVPGTLSAIVDQAGNLLPRGVVGELCLVGVQIARGYWNAPELTAEKFVDCPFAGGRKMYRTGDLARWNERGELEYLGRIDNQIKLRGFRIELSEIENAMNRFEGVRSAVVKAKEIGNVQHLCGYYTSDKEIDQVQLREYLSQSLTEYMVPSAFIRLETMPQTLNGKIDHKALQDKRIGNESVTIKQSDTPQTSKEAVLFELAATLLGTHYFGMNDDLTLVGLTSLTAIKLTAMANKKGIRIKTNDILRHKTIREIAAQNTSLGFWVNDNQENRPIAVIVHGFSTHTQLKQLTDKLIETHSVFVIEPIEEHYDLIFQDADQEEVINMYSTLLDLLLPENRGIQAFYGHSYGGVLAYCLAAKWETMTQQQSDVFLFDTITVLDNYATQSSEGSAVGSLPAEFAAKRGARIRQMEIMNALSQGVSMPAYDGSVVLFKALRPELIITDDPVSQADFSRLSDENDRCWRNLVPQIEIIPVDAGHYSIMDKKHMEKLIIK